MATKTQKVPTISQIRSQLNRLAGTIDSGKEFESLQDLQNIISYEGRPEALTDVEDLEGVQIELQNVQGDIERFSRRLGEILDDIRARLEKED